MQVTTLTLTHADKCMPSQGFCELRRATQAIYGNDIQTECPSNRRILYAIFSSCPTTHAVHIFTLVLPRRRLVHDSSQKFVRAVRVVSPVVLVRRRYDQLVGRDRRQSYRIVVAQLQRGAIRGAHAKEREWQERPVS